MDAVEIKGEEYCVTYDPATGTAVFQGLLRMSRYEQIRQLLDGIVANAPRAVTLDLRRLKFLNSHGINMLFGFVIGLRELPGVHVTVVGTTGFPWQGRTLKDLKKLMPALELGWVPVEPGA